MPSSFPHLASPEACPHPSSGAEPGPTPRHIQRTIIPPRWFSVQSIQSRLVIVGPRKMAWSMKHLPQKHEDLSLDSQHPHKEPGMAAFTHNPSTGVAEIGGSRGLAGYQAPDSARDLVSKNKVDNSPKPLGLP